MGSRTGTAAARARQEKHMTTAEYLETPETLQPREQNYGELHVADAPTVTHQRLVGRLFKALDEHVGLYKLGEVLLSPIDVILDGPKALVVQPDLVFVSAARAIIFEDRIWGAPDLAVEVLSPWPRVGRTEERVALFAKYGVQECWLVHQVTKRVEVVRFDGGSEVARTAHGWHEPIVSHVLPAFRVSIGSIGGW